jgi:hypothetical protein
MVAGHRSKRGKSARGCSSTRVSGEAHALRTRRLTPLAKRTLDAATNKMPDGDHAIRHPHCIRCAALSLADLWGARVSRAVFGALAENILISGRLVRDDSEPLLKETGQCGRGLALPGGRRPTQPGSRAAAISILSIRSIRGSRIY